jgi:hypothetical protein
MKPMKWLLSAGLTMLLVSPAMALADEERGVGDVVYVPTPQVVVEEMLRMAKLGPKDFIIDLGSGDGRMVITAAKTFGARGFGVDLSESLLNESNKTAVAQGVSDRAYFIKQNLFETDLNQATVISTYLLPDMNRRLRPKILGLKPGTRVVAHDYHMGDWLPDDQKTLTVPEKTVGTAGISYVFLWIVPAKVAGLWQSQIAAGAQPVSWEFEFKQTIQMVEGTVNSGGKSTKLPDFKLEGDQIGFTVVTRPGDNSTRHQFKGTVKGDVIEGTVAVGAGTGQNFPWTAKLIKRGDLKSFQSMATPQ